MIDSTQTCCEQQFGRQQKPSWRLVENTVRLST